MNQPHECYEERLKSQKFQWNICSYFSLPWEDKEHNHNCQRKRQGNFSFDNLENKQQSIWNEFELLKRYWKDTTLRITSLLDTISRNMLFLCIKSPSLGTCVTDNPATHCRHNVIGNNISCKSSKKSKEYTMIYVHVVHNIEILYYVQLHR
mgnify:CR=1 FL=1